MSRRPAPPALDEAAFIKQHLATLSNLRTTYPADYVPPLTDLPRRPPTIPIEVIAPPEKDASQLTIDSFSIIIKSLKPALSFPLTISPADPISTLKARLAALPRAPPPDAQRLLLKGKALADNKLVKEYDLAEGAVVNLMIKPGHAWTGEAADPMDVDPKPELSLDAGLGPDGAASPQLTPGGHPIPTLTLSTEGPSRPSTPGVPSGPSKTTTVPLNTDILTRPQPGPQPDPGTSHAYHATIGSEEFWTRLYGFLKLQFDREEDAAAAFEDFLLASKTSLSVDEIAKIRDAVGVVGMGGKGM